MPDRRALARGWQRVLWLSLAYLSIGMAAVGVVVPGLPTTEFVLLAAWAASRSSPRLSAWLEGHRLFGPLLSNWRAGGVITRRTKRVAILGMSVAFAIMAATVSHRPSLLFAGIGMACGALWILSRPERPRAAARAGGVAPGSPPERSGAAMACPEKTSPP